MDLRIHSARHLVIEPERIEYCRFESGPCPLHGHRTAVFQVAHQIANLEVESFIVRRVGSIILSELASGFDEVMGSHGLIFEIFKSRLDCPVGIAAGERLLNILLDHVEPHLGDICREPHMIRLVLCIEKLRAIPIRIIGNHCVCRRTGIEGSKLAARKHPIVNSFGRIRRAGRTVVVNIRESCHVLGVGDHRA